MVTVTGWGEGVVPNYPTQISLGFFFKQDANEYSKTIAKLNFLVPVPFQFHAH